MRARTLKPAFFRDADLCAVAPEDPRRELDGWRLATRLLFAGLWTLADRAGRLRDRPRQIRVDIFPCDPEIGEADVDQMLAALAREGFIQRYVVEDRAYIAISNFLKHQYPHKDEKPSSLPEPPAASTMPAPCQHHSGTIAAPYSHSVNPLSLLATKLLSLSATSDCANGTDTMPAPCQPDAAEEIPRRENGKAQDSGLQKPQSPPPKVEIEQWQETVRVITDKHPATDFTTVMEVIQGVVQEYLFHESQPFELNDRTMADCFRRSEIPNQRSARIYRKTARETMRNWCMGMGGPPRGRRVYVPPVAVEAS